MDVPILWMLSHTLWKSQNFSMHRRKCRIITILKKKRDFWRPEKRDSGRPLFKTDKLGIVHRKPERMEPFKYVPNFIGNCHLRLQYTLRPQELELIVEYATAFVNM